MDEAAEIVVDTNDVPLKRSSELSIEHPAKRTCVGDTGVDENKTENDVVVEEIKTVEEIKQEIKAENDVVHDEVKAENDADNKMVTDKEDVVIEDIKKEETDENVEKKEAEVVEVAVPEKEKPEMIVLDDINDEDTPGPDEIPTAEERGFWKAVDDNPNDFASWTYLLQVVEKNGKLKQIQKAFTSFLALYPYCYGYWKKYADQMKKLISNEAAFEVFNDAVVAIPLSVDLWTYFIHFIAEWKEGDESEIRMIYRRAVEACGQEYRSDKIWEAYVEWEKQTDKYKVLGLYKEFLGCIVQRHQYHFDKFREWIFFTPVKDMVTMEDIKVLLAKHKEEAERRRKETELKRLEEEELARQLAVAAEEQRKIVEEERLAADAIREEKLKEEEKRREEERLKEEGQRAALEAANKEEDVEMEGAEEDVKMDDVKMDESTPEPGVDESTPEPAPVVTEEKEEEKEEEEAKEDKKGRKSKRGASKRAPAKRTSRRSRKDTEEEEKEATETKEEEKVEVVEDKEEARKEENTAVEMETAVAEQENVVAKEEEKENVVAKEEEKEELKEENVVSVEKDPEEQVEKMTEDFTKVDMEEPLPDSVDALTDRQEAAVREQILLDMAPVHEQILAELEEVSCFEEGIKRPYFHVKELERIQLKNWKNYLNLIIEKKDTARTIILFERCLIACAFYEGFWIKYVGFMAEIDEEETSKIYRRACMIHLVKKPQIHLNWAAFEEKRGHLEVAREALDHIETNLAGLIAVTLRRAGLERRSGNMQQGADILKGAIDTCRGRETRDYWIMKYVAYMQFNMCDLEKTREYLKEQVERAQRNKRLYMKMLEVERCPTTVTPDVPNVIEVFQRALTSSLSVEDKAGFSHRRLTFLEEFGTDVGMIIDAYDDHNRNYKSLLEEKKRERESSSHSNNNTNYNKRDYNNNKRDYNSSRDNNYSRSYKTGSNYHSYKKSDHPHNGGAAPQYSHAAPNTTTPAYNTGYNAVNAYSMQQQQQQQQHYQQWYSQYAAQQQQYGYQQARGY